MTQWLFPPAPTPSLPIDGDARRLPVRRILCVGQNYAAHAREMGGDPDKPAPFFFAKPGDALVADGAVISWTYQELGLDAGQAVRIRNPIRLPAAS